MRFCGASHLDLFAERGSAETDLEERRAEIQRVKDHIDIAHRLGLKKMRHDVASFRRPMSSNTPQNFVKEFPWMVEGVRELADYAAGYGMTTTLENHGFFCQRIGPGNHPDRSCRASEHPNDGRCG